MIIGVLLSVHLNFIGCARQDSFPLIEGPYLGQKPPGMTPELFAPGLVSRGFHEHSLTISPDGKEMFFVMADAGYSVYRIGYLRSENDAWAVPQLAPFSSDHHDFGPTFAPDGRRLYFASSRPFGMWKKSGIPGEHRIMSSFQLIRMRMSETHQYLQKEHCFINIDLRMRVGTSIHPSLMAVNTVCRRT
jgi:hypothetical protein